MQIPSIRPAAVAQVRGEGELSGVVQFYPLRGSVLITADVTGLPQTAATGFFGFHIHEGGACTGQGFADTGGHYNPSDTAHPMHAGDLPPLLSSHGQAHLAVVTDRFQIAEIIGRTVVIHSEPDDFHTQPAGSAGDKIACGVIRAV